MDDSWSFRTERGRVRVADGHLRVEGSVVGVVRSTYHERWTRARPAWKALYLFSFAGTAMWFGRVLPAVQSLVGPDAVSPIQWFTLTATAFAVLVAARQTVGHSEKVPLERVEAARRGGRTFTVEYAGDGERETLDVVALTDEDAEQATEILRLKGVDVEATEDGSAPDERESASDGFRERLSERSG